MGVEQLRLLVGTEHGSPEGAEANLFAGQWPAFISADDGVKPYLTRRASYFPEWDFHAVADDGRLVGIVWGVPLSWDGNVTTLPSGYTDALRLSVEQHERLTSSNTFSLMGISVRSDEPGHGWASAIVSTVRKLARDRGFARFIAPLRPTWKYRYPLTDIREYSSWVRSDGLPLDPWLRVHVRLGATIVRTVDRSQTMTGTVRDWERWSGRSFPANGTYVIRDGLGPLLIDLDNDRGIYQEPGIWVQHP